jgi:nucleolar complex protein 2
LDHDKSVGYQLGFQYIRTLCLHLRTIRNSLNSEALKSVYSWQFYNCMKLWVLALTNATTSDLVLLVHPLVQLIVGTIRLTTNIKHFPLHLKSFELLTMINQKTGQFVPAA